jgi:predicted ATPase/DNA-binding XRE family transcriptional regulator
MRRKAKGLTQEGLAELARCDVDTVRKIEAGVRKPAKDLAAKLSAVLEKVGAETALSDRPPFAEWVRQQRDALCLTQKALGERIGLAEVTIRKAESGSERPSVSLARALAGVFGIPPAERDSFVQWARSSWASREAAARLPVPATRFIGRTHDIEQVEMLLADDRVRLVTLTGPGGVGKSRLALQVATNLREAFAQGVRFVSLDAIPNGEPVAPTLAQALSLPTGSNQLPVAELIKYFQDKHILLILDNFETVVPDAPLLGDLLQAAAGLKILITSRELLHVYGEHDLAVPPLAVPDLRLLPVPDRLLQYDAVRLFVERAQAVKPEFRLTAENARAVVTICARLDGLPLAIELAAAHIRHFSPAGLLDKLEDGITLLADGPRDQPARQRTLRDTIAWSYQLLSDKEQHLFRCLAVFAGGCTVEAAVEVCYEGAAAQESQALDTLFCLVDKSLLLQEEGRDGQLRFGMLGTIRAYAQEQLIESGEAEQIERRHALYYLSLVETTVAQIGAVDDDVWQAPLAQEHDNVRAAFSWVQRRGEQEPELYWRFFDPLWNTGLGIRLARTALNGMLG